MEFERGVNQEACHVKRARARSLSRQDSDAPRDASKRSRGVRARFRNRILSATKLIHRDLRGQLIAGIGHGSDFPDRFSATIAHSPGLSMHRQIEKNRQARFRQSHLDRIAKADVDDQAHPRAINLRIGPDANAVILRLITSRRRH